VVAGTVLLKNYRLVMTKSLIVLLFFGFLIFSNLFYSLINFSIFCFTR